MTSKVIVILIPVRLYAAVQADIIELPFQVDELIRTSVQAIRAALQEDSGVLGDVTTLATYGLLSCIGVLIHLADCEVGY